MMREPEKSDSVVVAGKPTNKAERSAAEPVEPRTGTKGNAGQQSTRRAQDRASVSQALERVRQAARQGKKERFTSLLHHLDPAMLRTAFYAMKRDAAPGVDGITWETYEKDLDRRIEDLHARVKRGAYRGYPPNIVSSVICFTLTYSIPELFCLSTGRVPAPEVSCSLGTLHEEYALSGGCHVPFPIARFPAPQKPDVDVGPRDCRRQLSERPS
jgi:hypothetical protein